ncbi:adenine phosphoribosyltransferase [Pontixanthobacter gangjinensis]|uniref:Adenine phosphoribosyltransferase n=1 Tax=Pontixanthobacter gangjinensis TaxID=1028742 RepID=A0A6I4SL94_9SPHN|nr:adenine phosphoribosyltransferase [Pontixanthobacter gangjinensis]MXO55577.1 adenine phosphoribosyltransferase [Pontixanthobacter gangjinensis]
MTPDELKLLIRTVPDFPNAGIQFRDITTLIGNGRGLAATVQMLAEAAQAAGAAGIAGMEARGFIFGAAVAVQLELPFIPIRKPGKLPIATIGVDYALEYGSDRLEIDPDAIEEGDNVVIVDDLIATGGTAEAAAKLLRMAGANVEQSLFVIDLPDLGGARLLEDNGVSVFSIMQFEGE